MSFVAVTSVESTEVAALEAVLARNFVTYYAAPSEEAALPVAREEIAQMVEFAKSTIRTRF